MNKHVFQRVKKSIHFVFHQRDSVQEFLCNVSNQVSLLALLVALFISIGFRTRFFTEQSVEDTMLAIFSLIMLLTVVVLNVFKRFEPANVLLYVSFNIITLVAFRDLPGQAVEGILIYVFLLSLVGFLFQSVITRLICMGTIIFRIIFFELHTAYIRPADGWLPGIAGMQERLVIDCMLLTLIVLVFVLYGVKLYAAEQSRKKAEYFRERNALFAQHMSHDLQVSWHAVASMIYYFKYKSDTKGELTFQKAQLDELDNASAFYSYILNNFLAFSRVEGGKLESNHYEKIELESELHNIVGLYRRMAEEKDIRILLNLDNQLPDVIWSDKIKVTRIVLNLLMNAISNTTPGKTITITVRWKGGPWELSVANEGDGLQAEELRQLFTPYETAGTSGGRKRLGLGLPITKQLVEALGGNITATSQINRETLFTVAFPVE